MRTLQITLFLLLTLTSCGYRQEGIPSWEDAETISIPYTEGDPDGQITKAIIYQIAASGRYVYVAEGGCFLLRSRVINEYDENIGFRYEKNKKCKMTREIVPVETRGWIVVEVELLSSQGALLRGPCRLQANTEFDHDYYTIRDRVNIFSLGQLTDVDSAQDASLTPLYQNIAEKIAEWLIHG
jgi:hypothetical protein